eukprot:19246-Heterococcus_DN1.PRE.1
MLAAYNSLACNSYRVSVEHTHRGSILTCCCDLPWFALHFACDYMLSCAGRRVFKFTAWINSRRRNGVPKTTSHVDDLPEQWKSQGRNYGPRAAENWQ